MLKIIFLISLFLFNVLNADNNITNPVVNSTINYNIPDAVSDTNVSQWNSSNWNDKLSKDNGYGGIGNTMMFLNNSPFLQKGVNTDTSELTVDSYNDADDATPAARGYTEAYRSSLMGKTSSNTAYAPHTNTNSNTLECFMARDLPFRYRCEETGLVYGGETIAQTSGGSISNMDGMSGKQALDLCKENCKQQIPCLEVDAGISNTVNIMNEEIGFDSNRSYDIKKSNLDYTKNVDFITLDVNLTAFSNIEKKELIDPKILMDISYVDKDNRTIPLVKEVWTRFMRGVEKLIIKNAVREINIKFYSKETNATISGSATNMTIHYQDGAKYICAPLQDVSQRSNETFAYQCPSGFKTSFGSFEICSQGVLTGDNPDGTFSSSKMCTNTCNISKRCQVEIGSFDATIFQQMREGRLGAIRSDGSFTSSDSNKIKSDIDCTTARETKQQILNEVVFDSKHIPFQTVLNGVLIPNVDRPRVMSGSNIDFETSKKEEWKDSAYENMLKDGTYSESDAGIGEDTNSSFAYGISLQNGSNYGSISSTSTRELSWKLKPSSKYYDNGVTYKLYAVIRVDAEKYGDTINGRERLRDQIWYIKTSEADTFVPFVRAQNYASATAVNIGLGNIIPKLSYNSSATYDAQTFTGSNWVARSLSSSAPSFKSTSFTADDFWYEFKIVASLGDIIYKLPGLVRSSSELNGVVSNTYTGAFDGTGDGVVGYEVYTFFSKDNMTYQDLKNEIDAIDTAEIHQVNDHSAKIYKSMEDKYFNKFIKADNISTDSNVEIYQYGTADKHSLKVRILPRKKDVGKNGFVYIFVY